MSEWQSISTAPKDGTTVILWAPGVSRPMLGHFMDEERRQFGKVVSVMQKWVWNAAIPVTLPEPTHWMPVPAAPGQTGERK